MLCAAIIPMASTVAVLALDMCGVIKTLSILSSSSSKGIGSGSVTSKAAPARIPVESAVFKDFESTIFPREVLIRKDPRYINLNCRSLIRW